MTTNQLAAIHLEPLPVNDATSRQEKDRRMYQTREFRVLMHPRGGNRNRATFMRLELELGLDSIPVPRGCTRELEFLVLQQWRAGFDGTMVGTANPSRSRCPIFEAGCAAARAWLQQQLDAEPV